MNRLREVEDSSVQLRQQLESVSAEYEAAKVRLSEGINYIANLEAEHKSAETELIRLRLVEESHNSKCNEEQSLAQETVNTYETKLQQAAEYVTYLQDQLQEQKGLLEEAEGKLSDDQTVVEHNHQEEKAKLVESYEERLTECLKQNSQLQQQAASLSEQDAKVVELEAVVSEYKVKVEQGVTYLTELQ